MVDDCFNHFENYSNGNSIFACILLVRFVKVNVESGADFLVEKLGIVIMPTILLIKEGKVGMFQALYRNQIFLKLI